MPAIRTTGTSVPAPGPALWNQNRGHGPLPQDHKILLPYSPQPSNPGHGSKNQAKERFWAKPKEVLLIEFCVFYSGIQFRSDFLTASLPNPRTPVLKCTAFIIRD